MEENHNGWKLVRGVRQDVVNLFKLFANTKSVRYEDFCKVWKQMNFSLIYSNRTTFIELLEFTEELLQIVKEYLLSVYEFHTRVAALYTLYGLYFKQPIREAAKIRFTKSEWEEVHSLIADCKAGKHYDVAFIHIKMYLNGAYSFTATIRPAGLERGFRKYSEKRPSIPVKTCDVELLRRPLISEDLINSLVKLESLYCRKKSELLGKRNLVFIDGKFAKSLQEEMQNYVSKKQRTTTNVLPSSSLAENPECDEDDDEDDEEDEGVVRRKLKAKSFKSSKNDEDEEDEEDKRDLGKRSQRERLYSKYADLLAKKKAEQYIKKLQEGCQSAEEVSTSQPESFDLPELDFF